MDNCFLARGAICREIDCKARIAIAGSVLAGPPIPIAAYDTGVFAFESKNAFCRGPALERNLGAGEVENLVIGGLNDPAINQIMRTRPNLKASTSLDCCLYRIRVFCEAVSPGSKRLGVVSPVVGDQSTR